MMSYTKPELLALENAVHAIQAGSEKPCSATDSSPTDHRLNTVGAYEADE
jgi:hypothetical protein